jgi:coenzyme F420-0:L-glutamate ligase/coenzyme F420-1:gamma-L-glutamate ligase
MTLTLTGISSIPIIKPGDNLGAMILHAAEETGIQLQANDVFVLAQKIVSKAEDRFVNLTQVEPSQEAAELAEKVNKDARLVELVLSESKKVIRAAPNVLIVEHKLGFICANAGIDHSNVSGPWGDQNDWVLLLPKDADASARIIRAEIEKKSSIAPIGIMIIDSHSRAWRVGTVGTTIGLASVPGVVDLRGASDIYGYKMQYTIISAADELAGAASLIMGQVDERIPVVHVRGFPYPLRESSLKEMLRLEQNDLFR